MMASISAWGERACGVLALAFCQRELPECADGRERSSRQNAATSTRTASGPRHAARTGRLFFGSMCALLSATMLVAQEPTPRSVRISFLPPPLEGSVSLGIYDTTGKLVRVLHREADFDAFEVGSDALSSNWDGKNDAGESLPPGKYHARGYVVGDLAVEGVGYFFNDWVTDEDSPHIRRIENFTRDSEQSLLLLATLPGGELVKISTDLEGRVAGKMNDHDLQPGDFQDSSSPEARDLRVEGGKLWLDVSEGGKPVSWTELIAPEDACHGRGETVWVIDHASSGDAPKEVKQFSGKGEFLRRLSFAADEPAPRLIRASRDNDKLFLLEESAAVQRLRALTLLEAKSENGNRVSDWKVELEKKIVEHKDFGIEGGKHVVTGTKTLPEKITIKLQPNPLEKGARASVELCVGHDQNGSFLQTSDGLPLESISETKNLTRIVLSPHGERAIDVFEDDDAVVEQFRVSGLDQMMAFDCGAFDLK